MPLPIIFAALTNPTMPMLDQDFAALGALTPIPCSTSGTNTLALTPLTNTPTVVAYANYGQFTSVATATNTGAVTAQVGGLVALSVYKDTLAGPVALAGNEIIIGAAFTLIYDSLLNTGAGGFHLHTGTSTSVGTSLTLVSLTATDVVATSLNATTFQIDGGATLIRNLSTTASLTFAALTPDTGTLASIILAGCSINDVVGLGIPAGNSLGMLFRGQVTNAGTIGLAVYNATASTIAALSGTYRVNALGYQ